MATQYNSIIRLKKIDECLRNKNKKYGLTELIEAIGSELEKQGKQVKVSERTVYDDLKFLKDEYGPFEAPIERTNEKGYHYKKSNFSIFNPSLDNDNIEKIQASLSTLRQVANIKGFEDLKEIVLRFEAIYNFDEELRIDPIVYLEEGLNIAAQKYIEPLKNYIKGRNTISITYQPFDNDVYSRIVSPYFIKEYNNRWFLIGHEHAIISGKYEGITNLSLDRIIAIKPSLKPYKPQESLDIKKYLNDVIGVSVSKGEKIVITFKVYGIRRHYVDTKKIHHTQKTIELNSAFGLFSISVIPNRELYSHLLSFGGDMEILTPEVVKGEMKKNAESLINRYQ